MVLLFDFDGNGIHSSNSNETDNILPDLQMLLQDEFLGQIKEKSIK